MKACIRLYYANFYLSLSLFLIEAFINIQIALSFSLSACVVINNYVFEFHNYNEDTHTRIN